MINALLVVVVAFAVMEPLTYLAHRYVMHGIGLVLHRSHHRRFGGRGDDDGFLEANDAFPVIFAAVTVTAMAAGFNVDGWSVLLPVGVGVTLYGAAYAFVHDVYIHERLGPRRRRPTLDRLARAHALHHRFGGEPYGMLFPVVPADVRARAVRIPVGRPGSAGVAAGDPAGQRVESVPRP